MLEEKLKYKAVLFDLDGVLVDMREAHYEALNLALLSFGAKIEETEHEETFNGLPSIKKLSLLAAEGRINLNDIEKINALKQEFTKQIIPRICTPNVVTINMMNRLRESDIRLGCCTNSVREMADLMLRTAGLFEFMEIIIGNDNVRCPKPDPEMYISAMEKLDVQPQETLIVEDSYYGIAAGRASGAVVIEVPGVEAVHMGLFEEIL